MDEQQLRYLYKQATQYMVNPPSFQTWMKARDEREAYRRANAEELEERAFRMDPGETPDER